MVRHAYLSDDHNIDPRAYAVRVSRILRHRRYTKKKGKVYSACVRRVPVLNFMVFELVTLDLIKISAKNPPNTHFECIEARPVGRRERLSGGVHADVVPIKQVMIQLLKKSLIRCPMLSICVTNDNRWHTCWLDCSSKHCYVRDISTMVFTTFYELHVP